MSGKILVRFWQLVVLVCFASLGAGVLIAMAVIAIR